MLTRKQNLLETMRGGNPDRFVNQYDYAKIVSDPIRQATSFGCPKGSTVVNAWGVTITWPDYTPGPFPDTSPDKVVIKDIEHWQDYLKVPSTDYPESAWEPFVKEVNAIDRSEYFVAPTEAPGIFERLHYLMGMEDCMIAFYDSPDEMHELIDCLTEWELAHGREIVRHYHPDALFHHDDWGSQKSTFLSPAMFKEFLLPAYKRIYGFWKENGVQLIIHHSDSYAATLVPDMIEMGTDIWQGAMTTNDLPALIKQYGGKITFQGGIDNGLVDRADWTEENCMKYTRDICKACGPMYFIPSTTMGGPDSTYPGVYECVSRCIDQMSQEMFPLSK